MTTSGGGGSGGGSATTTRYFHEDHLNSTNEVTDYRGNVVQTLDYYPYGSQRINVSTGANNEAKSFIGQVADPEDNLNYLNARYYNSKNGQFLSEDPVFLDIPSQQNLMNPQSLNSYSYANNNPIRNEDPDGNQTLALGGAAAGGTAISGGSLLLLTAALLGIWAILLTIQTSGPISYAPPTPVITPPSTIAQTMPFPIMQTPAYNLSAPTIGPGKDFTQGQKQDIIEKNAAANNGQPTCVNCGNPTAPAQQSQKGVTPPGDETQVDHRIPKKLNGTNDPSNGDVLCRDCNLKKGGKSPEDFYGGNGLPPFAI